MRKLRLSCQMSQDMGLELGRRCLGLKFVLLTPAKKLHPPLPYALIHYYILLAKIEKCLFSLGVHLHVPVFTLLLSIGYWCYYSVWLKLFKNGDVWENITGMRNPGTSNLCRVYDSMFGSRSTLQPCRKALRILDFLGYWCISERCSALFVEFGDSFQWHFADATLLVYMGIPKENWCMTLDVNLSSACVIVLILLHDPWPPGGFAAWVHVCKRQAST